MSRSPRYALGHRVTWRQRPRHGFDIGSLFGNGKEKVSLDHSQIRSTSALLHFWTWALRSSIFREEEQQRLQTLWQCPVTLGEALCEIPRRHRRGLLAWLHEPLPGIHLEMVCDLFAA